MSPTAHALVLAVFILASSVWMGGYVTIAVVARVATATLEAPHRVVFFRRLGRAYLSVGGPGLVIALATGAWLVAGHPWDGWLVATVIVAVALITSLAVGVAQARRMTRLRAAALAMPQDPGVTIAVHRGARAATLLRAAIGLLSLTLILLGSILAT